MVTLRPYQDAAIAAIREAFNAQGHRRVLFVLPTGGGKTVCFSYIAHRTAAAGKRVWIIAHRDELLRQISAALMKFDVPHGIIRGGCVTTWHDVQVCSVQTLVRRLDQLPSPDLIVIDEAHHAAAGSWDKITSRYATTPILGVTATPVRGDGKGLGDYFDTMVLGPTAAWLTDNGFLAPADIYTPELADMTGVRTVMGEYDKAQTAERLDKPTIYGGAVRYYTQLAFGKRIIVFCVNLTHVQHTLEAYLEAGIPAASLDGNMTAENRAQVNQDFEAAKIWVLVTCEIVSEGYDVPGCDGVQMLRPTQSEGLFLQQIGRGLRIAPGKSSAIIIDHVGNVGRYVDGYFIPKHGLPTDERNWELTKGKKKRDMLPVPGIRMCRACFIIMPVAARVCPKCGVVIPVQTHEIETSDEGELRRLNIEPVTAAEAKSLMENAKSLKDLHDVARRLGYRQQWAYHEYNRRREESIRQIVQGVATAPTHHHSTATTVTTANGRQ